MKIELTQNEIEAHLEVTQKILKAIQAALPQEKNDVFGKKHSISRVYINEDGTLIAEYSRYLGCGDRSTLTEYPNLSILD